MLTKEDQNSSAPLHGTYDVAKQNDRAQDGEELPCCRDDGAGKRSKVHDRHEDEGLLETKEWMAVESVRKVCLLGHLYLTHYHRIRHTHMANNAHI